MAMYYCDVMTQDGKTHKNVVYKEGNAVTVIIKDKKVSLRVLKVITVHHELNKGETFFKAYDEKIDNKRGFCLWVKKSNK